MSDTQDLDSQPVELVIFDCDGVLVDSERLSVAVESRLLANLGWRLTEQEVAERFVGRSDSYMQGEIERSLGRALPDWQHRYETALHRAFNEELRPVAGVVEALESLDSPLLQTCVASSGSHDKMRLTLGLTNLYDRFAGRIFSATEVENGKPAPDLFLHAAAKMGTRPERCVVVEDSPSGLAAARAGGMRSIALVSQVINESALPGPGTIVIRHMSELSGAIRRMN